MPLQLVVRPLRGPGPYRRTANTVSIADAHRQLVAIDLNSFQGTRLESRVALREVKLPLV